MPGPVYSTRLIAVHDQPAIAPATYLVPPGFTLIIRDIDVYFGSAISVRTVYARGSATQVFWQATVDINLAGWRQWTGRQVIEAGETFDVFATDVFDVTASGYLLAS